MYCKCGCGQITKVAKRTDTLKAWVKGQHMKFIAGHSLRINHKSLLRPSKLNQWVKDNQNKHICQCGCGGYIIIKKHHVYRRIPKYIHGHHANVTEYKAKIQEYNKTHLGEDSVRWVKDRSKVRSNRTEVDFTSTQKREIYLRDKGICQSCGTFCLLDVPKYDSCKANFDHIILVKDGGTREISNGQVLCYVCHIYKHSVVANQSNSGKPRTGNPEPSPQGKV